MGAGRARAATAVRVRKPRIGITVGDPAGIGPEISLKPAADPRVGAACEPILYGPHNPDALAPFVPGRLSADAGRAAFQAIAEAVEHVRLRRIDAIATAPINKEAFSLAGIPFKGHTDLLAMLTHDGPAGMMFHSGAPRGGLAAGHVGVGGGPRVVTRGMIRL